MDTSAYFGERVARSVVGSHAAYFERSDICPFEA